MKGAEALQLLADDEQQMLTDDHEYFVWLNKLDAESAIEREKAEETEMPIIAKNTGGDFTPVPEGTHIAVCNMVAEIGLQGGGQFAPKEKVYIRWELPNERIDYEDKEGPMVIGQFYTISLSEKANLRKVLEGWRGRAFTDKELEGFDLVNILGKACQILVIHNVKGEKTYANVSSVMALPKGFPVPEVENDLIAFSLDDQSNFNQIPEWLQKKINGRLENSTGESFSVQPTVSHTGNEFDDDIPF